jgi:DNA-binding NtrC family response regulator
MTRSRMIARELAGTSPEMVRLRGRVERVADTLVPVLVTGETGTGKTTVAQVLHRISERGGGPLVKVNCAGIPDTLFESELFGHEKGAFSGATRSRAGLLPRANGGTILLDELGELSAAGQAKLLTALDEGEVRPVGSERVQPIDGRLISATSRDLEADIGAGAFRSDLFHRVAVVRIHVPPLRTRRDDIPVLVANALHHLARRHGVARPDVCAQALAYLVARPWPGNVRELLHLLEAAVVLSRGAKVLGRSDLEDAAPEHRPVQRDEPGRPGGEGGGLPPAGPAPGDS